MSGHDALGLMMLVLSIGCGRPDASLAPAPPSSPAGVPSETPRGVPLPADASLRPAWSVLVRDEQWDAAWRALDALPEEDKSRPEIRYVRARVALARGDSRGGLALMDGLESTLPLLAADVERRRAEAEVSVGPFEQAGEWFAARAAPGAQLDAARAFERAGDARRARTAADHVIASEKRTHAQEGEARALRMRLGASVAETGDATDAARADARWLAIQGADLPAAAEALAALARDPSHPLQAQELFARAEVLSQAGRTDDALRAIDAAATAPARVPFGERLHARAMTLYRARGRYAEAARALSEAAALGGKTAAEDAFYSARALSRADRDEEAIRGYEDVQRRYPKSTWAEQAAFLVPYLRMLHGEWKECALVFGRYVRAHQPADSVRPSQPLQPSQPLREARSDGALCSLLDGDAKSARVEFEHLVEDEPDPLTSARLANMAALSAYRDGDRAHAVMRWTDVVRSRPLTWPALVASARLIAVGAPVPPPIDAAPTDSASDPAPLAITVPAPADLLHQLGLEEDAELALRERESIVASGVGARAPEALCTAYGQLGRARRRYQIAQSLPSTLFAVAPTHRTRWAWDCAFPAPYPEAVDDAEARERLPRGLLWAVMRQESGFDPDAVSPARAVGLMQLLPETARPLADELSLAHDDARLTSPPYAIRVGARALRKLLDAFHGNVPLAVAAYNGGAEAVQRWTSRAPGMQIDTFVERIPFKETREYVVRVMGNLARYGYLAAADAGIANLSLDF
jgi:soluble lytic murein transglycosylase